METQGVKRDGMERVAQGSMPVVRRPIGPHAREHFEENHHGR